MKYNWITKKTITFFRTLSFMMAVVLMSVNPVLQYGSIDVYALQLPVADNQKAYYDRMEILPVWDELEKRDEQPGQGVVIAILDTGLASSSTVINESRWCNDAELNGEEGVDDDENGYIDDIYGLNLANSYPEQTDSDGHGTQVASVIGMQGDEENGTGIAPGAKIMMIKISQDTNFDEDIIIEALEYAVKMGADVINMSFATYKETQKLKHAVYEASKSCVMVAAAGNEEYPTEGELTFDDIRCRDTYPASWDCCIGVMSYDTDFELAYFSNWDQNGQGNRKFDIIAPGEDVRTVTRGNKYRTSTGTSFSTAFVSGAVAITKQITGDSYSAPELKDYFLSLMDKYIVYQKDGYEFQFPELSFSAHLALLQAQNGDGNEVSGNSTDDPGTLSGNDAGNGQEQQTDPNDPSSVSENDTDDPASVSGNDADDPSSVSGNGTTGNPEDPSGGQGSGQNPADTNDPVAGVVEKPETGLPGGEEVEQIPQIIENGENGKTEENREPPSIGKIKQTKKKLIINIEDLPKDGKVMLRLYKNSRRICKVKVTDSKVIIRKKKLSAKGKLKIVLSWNKDKKTQKSSKKIRLT